MNKDKHTAQIGRTSDGLASICTPVNIGNIVVGNSVYQLTQSTVTTVMLILRRKYCLSALAYGLYGLKER